MQTSSSNAATNKRVVEGIFQALAQGDGRPFGEAMAEDFSWTITGHGPMTPRR